jgi:hypothetical protein
MIREQEEGDNDEVNGRRGRWSLSDLNDMKDDKEEDEVDGEGHLVNVISFH